MATVARQEPAVSSPLQNRLRLSQLRLLVHIAETGSLQAASQRLHLSQPAATKSLKQLELAVGSPLVQRGTTGSVLTATGELLCRRARFILAELRSVEDELGLFRAGSAGQVVIGALQVAAPALLPKTLQHIAQDYPRITVRVIEGTSDTLFPRLKEGGLDLLVGRFWPQEEPDFINEILFDSRFALAARAQHPLGSRSPLRLEDTMASPWILPPPGAHTRTALEAMFIEASLKPPQHSVETSSYLIIRSLLMSTDMLCPLPIETLQADVSLGLLRTLPVALDLRLPPVGFVRSVRHEPSPALETFVACLRAAAHDGLTKTEERSPLPDTKTKR